MRKHLLIKLLFAFLFSTNLFGIEKTNMGPFFPDKPVILAVSVDTASGNVVLLWKESTELNITKYLIFWEKEESNIPLIDSVYILPLNNYYNDINYGKPEEKSEPYMIQSFNDIGTGNSSEFSVELSTLYTNVVFDSCIASNTISWESKFGIWTGNTENYYILCSVNNNSFESIATITGTDTSFVHTNVLPNSTYTYIVQANKENDTLSSFSNKVTTQTDMAILPAYINADYTQVIDENSLKVSFTIDPNSEINHYKLLRSANKSGPFDTINEYTNYSQYTIIYTDNDINTEKETYFYQLLGVNYCNRIFIKSNLASNILLTASESSLIVSLNWNEYLTWLGDVEDYTVFRTPQDDSSKVSGNANSFSDNLSQLEYNDVLGKLCYYITAKEGNSNPYGLTGNSKSNTACVNIANPFKIGNALNPNSGILENTEFKPFLSFLPKQYLFLIYDRWGKKVFETTDPTQGWKGTTLSGNEAGAGVYIYKIKITSHDNVTTKHTGHVTLVYQ